MNAASDILPDGLHDFLASSGWGDAQIEVIPGDASFRRYFRVRKGDGSTAMLMFAPPPHEDPQPFFLVAHWLSANGMRAPEILAQNPREGWVLIEDFGNDRMRDWLDLHPEDESAAYEGAIDALVELHHREPGPFSPYDWPTYEREVNLLPEWFCPAHRLDVDAQGYAEAWREVLAPLEDRARPRVTVLRDYHAENIMLLGSPQTRSPQGIIDFQDALVGHPAYDLVSLLQDARRDVAPELETAMLQRYRDRAGVLGTVTDDFDADYARLGALSEMPRSWVSSHGSMRAMASRDTFP